MAKQSGAHCHILVAKTAQDMTRVLYAELMRHNDLFKIWKDNNPGLAGQALEDAFVKKNWGRQVEEARATLAKMLNTPIDDILKDQIAEALILDRTLKKGRQNPSKIVGRLH